MSVRPLLVAATAAFLAVPAFAGEISVMDPYARTSTMKAQTGAAFMMIHNKGEADRLIGVTSPVAERVELHTHKENAQGVMQMIHVEEGFEMPADGMIVMERVGHHVMFLGLTRSLKQDDIVPVTLIFEKAGEVNVDVPVDLERKPQEGHKMQHGQMKSGG